MDICARDAVATWNCISGHCEHRITIDEILNRKVVRFPMSDFHDNKCENFNSQRLQSTAEEAYPITDRPRGDADIASVVFHQSERGNPIVLVCDVSKSAKGRIILLDGAHRIVAHHINKQEFIYAKVMIVA